MRDKWSRFLPLLLVLWISKSLSAQSVCLPAPRLLTTMPMGGQAGTTVEVAISGQHLEGATQLRFSDERIKAEAATDANGEPVPNRFVVSIAADCPEGLYEASVMTPLGLSASRAFSVSRLPETTHPTPATELDSAPTLVLDSICNGTVPVRAISHHKFQAKAGQRILVDCAAGGIDSKLKPVVIIADANGNDLIAQRRGDPIDFRPPGDGTYVVKVHDLTFKGGSECFYRLALRTLPVEASVSRQPSTRRVSAFSWPPHDLADQAAGQEHEPNDGLTEAQAITLPCDLSGSFAPAADWDTFQFEARKGDVWWVEVASERLGRPTDPTIVIHHVGNDPESRTLVAELNDIPSPIKVSGNNYSYDGPPYNAGSSDVLGKFEVKQDGMHQLRLTDAFGGTRNDPANIYRLVIRKAEPDFALVAWAMHMQLRNGDRNCLSKPMALRPGATMPLEVVAVRRDGFDGPIQITMNNLPDGVTATGLEIPAGQSKGMVLVTADEGAPAGYRIASFTGTAEINGQQVTRPCHLASMAWPVTNHWNEIPSPRLLAEVPVSVGEAETAPITIGTRDDPVFTAAAGSKVTIPLIHMRRSEFSGNAINMRTMGNGFEKMPQFDLPLTEDTSQVEIDLAAMKTPPGEYTIAFYGGAVAKYRPDADKPPKDIADIVVSKPITIRVTPADQP